MNESSRAPDPTLVEIVARFGVGVLDEARRFEAVAADLFPLERRRERVALVTAVRDAVPQRIREAAASPLPTALALARLTDRLAADTAMDATLARWAVTALAGALGVDDHRGDERRAGDGDASAATTLASDLPHAAPGIVPPRSVTDRATPSPTRFVGTSTPEPPPFTVPPPPSPGPSQASRTPFGDTVPRGIGLAFVLAIVVAIALIGLAVWSSLRSGSSTAPQALTSPAAVSTTEAIATLIPFATSSPASEATANAAPAPSLGDRAGYVPYADGAIWRLTCRRGDRAFDETMSMRAQGTFRGQSVFGVTYRSNAPGAKPSFDLESVDGHGSAYLLSQDGEIEIFPGDLDRGFVARWNVGTDAVVRRFADAGVATIQGKDVPTVSFRDDHTHPAERDLTTYARGFGISGFRSQPASGPELVCTRP